MTRLVLLATVLLAACGGATGPTAAGLDPTALIRNHTASPIQWSWFDGSARSGVDTIPGMSTRCEHFTAQADSARFDMVRLDTLTTAYGWHTYTSNWFDPLARPTWTVDQIVSVNILVQDTTTTPC